MSTRYSRARFGAAVAVAFICGLVFASGFNLTRFSWAQGRLANSTQPPHAAVASAADVQAGFESVVDRARPAVVSIQVETYPHVQPSARRQRGQGRSQGQEQLPPGMEEFFRQFGMPNGGGQMQPPDNTPEMASGSGFIVSPDGYILTNNHVVAGADKVTVTLFDKRVFTAKVVGTDPTTDIAVVKIDANNLATLSLGDDSQARVGQWVLAIGNPMGDLPFTVTAGIVSAKGRDVQELRANNPNAITDYIQTDAAINPGNSGGPLLNIEGQVIGINAAIESGTGSYTGYGFAIPISLAKNVMNDIIKYGHVRRAVLGVQITDVTPAAAKAAGLSTIGGAMIESFSPENDSPAKEAGAQTGDIIVAVNGQAVDQPNTLQRLIRGHQPGEEVNIDVMRFGQKKTLHVRLGSPSADTTAVASNDTESGIGRATPTAGASVQSSKLGITVQALAPDEAQQLQVPTEYRHGLLVTDVSSTGPAFGNLFAGQEIIEAVLYPQPRRSITTPQQFEQVVSGLHPGDVLEVEVYVPPGQGQPGSTRIVSMQLDK